MKMYETILLDKQNAVATLTINRPEFGNAFALTSYTEIRSALDDCGADSEVRAVLITGAGKNFSAGGDIQSFSNRIKAGGGINPAHVMEAGRMSDAVRRCPKPVVAMINGAAAGAGCALALACDFRVMSPKSKLVMAFVNMGFSGDTGGIYFLSRLVGMARVTEMLALGAAVGAQEALQWGLTNRVAETDEELGAAANALARQLAARPGRAIALQKRLYYEFFYRDLTQFNIREGDYMHECSLTLDHAEAVGAFLEKRQPAFTGQ